MRAVEYLTKRVSDDTLLSEVQTITVTDGSGDDTFTITLAQETTESLAWNVSAADMQTALEALGGIGAGNVSVSGSGGVYTVTFQGALASTAVAQLESTPTGCTVVHTTPQEGGLQQLIKSSAGVLHSILVGGIPITTGNLQFYDGLDATGTRLGCPIALDEDVIVAGGVALYPLFLGPLDWSFRTGLFVDKGTLGGFGFTVAYL